MVSRQPVHYAACVFRLFPDGCFCRASDQLQRHGRPLSLTDASSAAVMERAKIAVQGGSSQKIQIDSLVPPSGSR